jgi:plasmid segregation protein ParM
MKIGWDFGSDHIKISNLQSFPAKCSKVGNLLKSSNITIGNDTYYIGEGERDTEYRKVYRKNLIPTYAYSLATQNDNRFLVVAALPYTHYKQDKDVYANMLKGTWDVIINGISKRITVDDVIVYPEGIASVFGTNFEGILLDIGGRTTDAIQIYDENGIKRYENPLSIPMGTLNLYSDFIKSINSKGYDLRLNDAERILRKGFKYNGEPIDVGFAMDVFKEFVETVVSKLQVEYSLRSQDVMLTGGGSQLMFSALKKRLPNATLMPNPVFANAIGLKKVGDSVWH